MLSNAVGYTTVEFPKPFTTAVFCVLPTPIDGSDPTPSQAVFATDGPRTLVDFKFFAWRPSTDGGVAINTNWFALGI
ncbi:hypothetical protein GBZ26_04080 [Azospirillum formosense]|uniref:Putative tail fiber protein gp53-like C-terminal domain-containing protein n=1 Tax=Azospirillum formosense TaxID=861533 RepID=A0ABX2KXX5_9PROT|nr:hypothetical protein [Azospirillum formosense]